MNIIKLREVIRPRIYFALKSCLQIFWRPVGQTRPPKYLPARKKFKRQGISRSGGVFDFIRVVHFSVSFSFIKVVQVSTLTKASYQTLCRPYPDVATNGLARSVFKKSAVIYSYGKENHYKLDRFGNNRNTGSQTDQGAVGLGRSQPLRPEDQLHDYQAVEQDRLPGQVGRKSYQVFRRNREERQER